MKDAIRLSLAGSAILFCSALFACGPANETAEGSGDASYADRMSEQHAGETPEASDAVTAESPNRAVNGETIAYSVADDQTVEGYLAAPVDGATAGLIVIHEWWGLNDNVRAMARRYAGEGYLALAVDLYNGAVADTPERARELMQGAMADRQTAEANLKRAIEALRARGATHIGVVGWCFGGGWALQTGLLAPDEIDAVIMYYGRPETDRDRLALLKAPLLGHFGALDRGIPVDAAHQLANDLEALDKEGTVHIYDHADHAFANPSGQRYQKGAAEDAWNRDLEFLRRTLKSSDSAGVSTP